jgi:HK97 family phage portal protein
VNIFERARTWIDSAFSRKNDPTYAITAQFFSPGSPIWSSKDYRTYVSKGYRTCGTVYNCVNKIAGAAAGITWKLYTDRSESREISSHPLLDLWRAPNPRMGSGSFVEQCFGHWHLSGNCYIYANRPAKTAPPDELWPLRPDLVKIVAGEKEIAGYVYGYGTSRAQDFDPEQIMHLKFPAYDDDFYGLSPVEVAMQLVDQQNEGNAWNTALMQNAGKPASVFMSKGYLTLEQRTQVRQELLKRYSGKRNAGMPMVLEADMTWQSMAMSPYELDWLESRELNTREIAAIFDVAPELVGDSAGKTFANQKEAKQSLYTENVLPKMDRYRDHLNAWLLPMYPDLAQSGAWFTYDKNDIEVLAELYSAAQQALSQQATEMWNSGQCTLRVAQRLQGLPERPKVYLDVYKFGAVLVREEDLEAYAQQALQKPAAPPQAVPEPLLNQPAPGQAPATLPAPNESNSDTKPKPQSGTSSSEESDDAQDKHPEQESGKTPAPSTEKYRLSTPGNIRGAEIKILDLEHPEEKAAYAQDIEERRARWEETIAARLQAYFRDEQQAVTAAVTAAPSETSASEALERTLDAHAPALQQVVYTTWYEVGQDFGSRVAGQLAAASAHTPRKDSRETNASGLTSLFSRATITYLLNLAGTKVRQITTTTLTMLRQALADGVAEGESISQLARRIDALYLEEIIPRRSTVIARTEVVGASNWAAMQAAQQSGLTLNKVWLATGDARTRPAHADADGQEVGIEEPFEVGGEALAYPGDPSGSAGNIVDCRCTVYFTQVQSNGQEVDLGEGDGQGSEGSAVDEGKVIRLARRHTYRSVREFREALA